MELLEFFIDIVLRARTVALGVDSAYNRSDQQENLLWVKVAGA
jgi:hypothetical protein